MNPIDLTSYVIECRKIAEAHRNSVHWEDFEAACFHLESIRFHLARGDQTTAVREYNSSLNFISALFFALGCNCSTCYQHKHFVSLWAHSIRKELSSVFPDHRVKFKCDVRREDWIADLTLRSRKTKYSLQVILEDNDDAFIITTKDDVDQRELYHQVAITPTLHHFSSLISQAYISICLNHSNYQNSNITKKSRRFT